MRSIEITGIIKGVADAMQDEESKKLLMYKLGHYLTGDIDYLRKMDEYVLSLKKLGSTYNTTEALVNEGRAGHGAILYGTGNDSGIVLRAVRETGISVEFFCDRDKRKHKTFHMGIPVISPEELLSAYSDRPVIVASSLNARDIYLELTEKGFSAQNIYFPSDRLALFHYFLEGTEQYFGEGFIRPDENEIFIDAGSYDGDTIVKFLRFCGKRYKKIVAFEPDPENYGKLQVNTAMLTNVELHNKGVWDRAETLRFNMSRIVSQISDSGVAEIETVGIDEVMCGEAATFIKMDVEGAELKALAGARETIMKHKPRLAICVYHKPEDILEIPLYIKSLVPEYRFWLRHYGPPGLFDETVLYAVAE